MTHSSPLIPVSVGVIYNPQNDILICLRPADKSQGGLWEFPGGKIEANETPEAALSREIFEEVGLVVTTSKQLMICEHVYQHHRVELIVFEVRQFTGIAYGKEQQLIRWVTPETLFTLPLLSGNHSIVTAIAAIRP